MTALLRSFRELNRYMN